MHYKRESSLLFSPPPFSLSLNKTLTNTWTEHAASLDATGGYYYKFGTTLWRGKLASPPETWTLRLEEKYALRTPSSHLCGTYMLLSKYPIAIRRNRFLLSCELLCNCPLWSLLYSSKSEIPTVKMPPLTKHVQQSTKYCFRVTQIRVVDFRVVAAWGLWRSCVLSSEFPVVDKLW